MLRPKAHPIDLALAALAALLLLSTLTPVGAAAADTGAAAEDDGGPASASPTPDLPASEAESPPANTAPRG